MEIHERLQELIAASAMGNFSYEAALDRSEINYSLIELLKKTVDRFVRSDVRQALNLAELTHRLSSRISDPFAHALGLRARAQALHYLGNYPEANEFYRQAKDIYETGGKPVEGARIARAMIDSLTLQSNYDEALALAAEARVVLEAANEEVLLAQLETNVGNLYYRLDQYQAALNCYLRAQKVFAAHNDKTALAIITFDCANCYSSLDDFRQAQLFYQQAYEYYTAQEMTLAAAHATYSIGYLHFLKGEYHQAIRVLHEVQEELTKLGDERHCALCHLDLAEIYLRLNVLDEAVQMATQARQRFQKLGNPYESAKALVWQGLAYLHQAKPEQAEQALRTAQKEFQTEGNEVFLGLIDLYLAELALSRNQTEAALTLAGNADELFSRLNLKSKKCAAQLVVARALLQSGQWSQAREICSSVLEASVPMNAPWLSHQVHDILGDVSLAENDPTRAYEHYVQAISFIEHIRSSIRVDEFRSAFFKDKLRVYEKLIRLCLEHGSADKQAEAFFYLESRKARTLVDLLINELEVAPVPDNGANDELYQRWQKLREELHWFYSKVNQHETSPKSRLLTVDQNLRAEISSRENALSEVARQAQIQAPDFVWLQSSSGMTITELRSTLADDEAVIEYCFDDNDLKIFAIDKNNLYVKQSACGRDEIKQLILELKFQLEKFHYGPAYIAAHQANLQLSTDASLRKLYEALFAPIASLVTDKKLIFIPFDVLHNVPFQALYDGENYLLDKHEIATVPSARLLAICARKPMRVPGRALIFGAADEIAPNITEEIQAISTLFPQANCFTGAAADVRTLAEHLPASDVVHIASHAVFRQDNPMFSAFKLAGTWLNFYDVCALRIQSALVTLSGCSTGTNRIHAGDEILGLVRGFLTAGASALVVSLWAVNDPATAKLMTAFYARLQSGAPPRQALRDAALMIKQQYPHPYYWAPFVFIGHTNNVTSSDGCPPGKLN